MAISLLSTQSKFFGLIEPLIRQIWEYLEHPKEGASLRPVCSAFKKYYPLRCYLHFDQKSKTIPQEIYQKVIKEYSGNNCTIFGITAVNHEWTDLELIQLQKLPLQELSIGGKKVSEVGMKAIATLPLRKLSIIGLGKPNDNLKHLEKMRLETFSLISDCITDYAVIHLKDMPLKHLYLGANRFLVISQVGMSYLKHVPRNKIITQVGVFAQNALFI